MYYGFRLVTTVFALASMIFVSSYAAQGSSAEDTAGGIQPANQVVMVDDTASVEDEATFGASALRSAPSRSGRMAWSTTSLCSRAAGFAIANLGFSYAGVRVRMWMLRCWTPRDVRS